MLYMKYIQIYEKVCLKHEMNIPLITVGYYFHVINIAKAYPSLATDVGVTWDSLTNNQGVFGL